MARTSRSKPEHLARKLLQVRTSLGFSQSEFLRLLGLEEMMPYKRISDFERGNAEPSLPVLLRYARVANISTDVLIDDELDLPVKLPYSPPNKKSTRRR